MDSKRLKSFALTVEKSKSTLQLLQGELILGEKGWFEARDMGRQLFEAIQELLEENGLKPGDIEDFEIKTDVSDNFTSVKIAETVRKTFLFAQKSQNLVKDGGV